MIAPVFYGAAATVMTFAGGVFTLRWRSHLTLVVAFAAGMVLGVSLFDLLPEAIVLAGEAAGLRAITLVLGVSFSGYLLLDRALAKDGVGALRGYGRLAPTTLVLHSLFDGVGIVLASHVGGLTGWLVALAVLAHDFADGTNIVGLALSAGDVSAARIWLAIDALAPLAGVLVGMQLQVTSTVLGLVFAAFAGTFLYIGACELIPRSGSSHATLRSGVMTVAAIAIMAILTGVAR